MPHDGQFLPLAPLRGAAALMGVLIVIGCTRSGDVVVVLDSTTRAESVEVVALPIDPRSMASSVTTLRARSSDSVSRLRSLDDSAAALDARFRALRDSLTADVQSLDTADRRTRSYAVRYAGIRRRTLGAEALRGARDSARARANRLRTSLGPRADTAAVARGRDVAARSPDRRRGERHPVPEGTLTLSLAPGKWWIGVARSGEAPTRYDSVTVHRGVVDTVRVGSRTPP